MGSSVVSGEKNVRDAHIGGVLSNSGTDFKVESHSQRDREQAAQRAAAALRSLLKFLRFGRKQVLFVCFLKLPTLFPGFSLVCACVLLYPISFLGSPGLKPFLYLTLFPGVCPLPCMVPLWLPLCMCLGKGIFFLSPRVGRLPGMTGMSSLPTRFVWWNDVCFSGYFSG